MEHPWILTKPKNSNLDHYHIRKCKCECKDKAKAKLILSNKRMHPSLHSRLLPLGQQLLRNVRIMHRTRPLRAQRRSRHERSRRKTNTALIHSIRINPKRQTSPTNPVPAPGQKHVDLIPTDHTRMTEMRGEGDLRIEHAALNLGSEFFALFDAAAEEVDSRFQGG